MVKNMWLSQVPLMRATMAKKAQALRAALKEKDQRLSALEAKFDSFSNEQKDGSNKHKKPARKNEKECT
jgi:hypothetical protein